MAYTQDPTTESTRFSTWRLVLGQGFAVLLLASGLLALKIVNLHGIIITGSSFTTPFCFAFFVMIGEVYGYGAARTILYVSTLFVLIAAFAFYAIAQMQPGLVWSGEEGVVILQQYIPLFVFCTAIAIVAAQAAMVLTLKAFERVFQTYPWIRLFLLPLVAQAVGGSLIVLFCFYRWLDFPTLVALIVSRVGFALLIGAITLSALYGAVGAIRRAENREAMSYAVKSADIITFEQEQRYRSMADAMSDAIIGVDDHSMIRYANPALARLFGYESINELVGAPLSMIQPPEYRDRHAGAMRRYVDGQPPALVSPDEDRPLFGLCKDGSCIPITVRFLHYRQNGRLFFSGIITPRGEDHGRTHCLPSQ